MLKPNSDKTNGSIVVALPDLEAIPTTKIDKDDPVQTIILPDTYADYPLNIEYGTEWVHIYSEDTEIYIHNSELEDLGLLLLSIAATYKEN